MQGIAKKHTFAVTSKKERTRMIKIDMEMPKSCNECPFIDDVMGGCNASGEPGFTCFTGLQKVERVTWDEWNKKVRSGRDPRCPLIDDQGANCERAVK